MDYLVTGKKGSGKSLVCVGRMREALKKGAPVATNLDLNLDKLLPKSNKTAKVWRLPDRPTRADLDIIGVGNPDVSDESKNGVLVLDELATWLNARTFQDKERHGLLDWLVHSRKLGWDTYLIAQHPNQIDKQIREALCEYHVICRRLDRLKVPFLPFKMPRIHVAFVRYGFEQHAVVADRWIYRGNDLFQAYDTRQIFEQNYTDGPYMLLPPAYIPGKPVPTLGDKVAAWLKKRNQPRQLKPKLPEIEQIMKLPPDSRIHEMHKLGFVL